MGKVLKIREIGEPILNSKCEDVDVENINDDILDVIEDLKATLEYGTGLGIAAPQIGVNKRIIVVGAKKENIKYNDAEEIPVTAMINPTWKKLSEDTDIQYEGCMSVPSIRGKVERYKNIEVTYYNENGEKIARELQGFFARLVQHECDHLDGIVFLDKVKGPNGFATKENIDKYDLRENERLDEDLEQLMHKLLEDEELDPRFMEAIDLVVEEGIVSTSFLQRRLRLGYNRTARMIDKMEDLGIASGFYGSKPRKVLLSKERWERIKGQLNIRNK